MKRVMVTTRIDAPIERVWRALTVPAEVSIWDGVVPVEVRDDYPQPGHHARWGSRLGPFRLTLHDHIRVVEPGACFAADIDIAFVHVDETYRLRATEEGSTELVTDDLVTSRIPGLEWLAQRLARANVNDSMNRLRDFCERS